jgi:hypothetical protein
MYLGNVGPYRGSRCVRAYHGHALPWDKIKKPSSSLTPWLPRAPLCCAHLDAVGVLLRGAGVRLGVAFEKIIIREFERKDKKGTTADQESGVEEGEAA